MKNSKVKFKLHTPDTKSGLYVAPSAVIIGEVTLAQKSSVWPNSVLRGDVDKIVVGKRSNIQDGTVIHTSPELPVLVGNNVTIGHRAIIHGSKVKDNSLIGMGAILLDGSEVGENTIIAAGSVVPENKKLKSGKVYMGIPATVSRSITDQEKEMINDRAVEYEKLAANYVSEG
ncbi:MAG: gamma carbonic anhydrase family protein [Elusimicrobiota bacterium]